MKLDQPSYHCITWRCQFGTEHVRLQPVMVEKATRKSQANQNRVQVQTSRLRFRITDMQNWHPNILVMSIIPYVLNQVSPGGPITTRVAVAETQRTARRNTASVA